MNSEQSFASVVLSAWEGRLDFFGLIDAASRYEEENLRPLAAVLYQTWLGRNQSPYAHAAYFNLGATLASQDDLPGAEAAYRQAIRLSPTFLQPRLKDRKSVV